MNNFKNEIRIYTDALATARADDIAGAALIVFGPFIFAWAYYFITGNYLEF